MSLHLTPQERGRLELWFELLQRYQHLDEKKMLPVLAVRLICVRHGYDAVIARMKSHGEDVVVQAAMDSLHEMAKMWFHMVQRAPPPAEHLADMMEGIRVVQVGSRSAAISGRVFKMLSRILIREAVLKQRPRPVQ